MSSTGRYNSPDSLGRVGRTTPEAVVWATVPSIAVLEARYELPALPFVGRVRSRIGVALGRFFGRPGTVKVAVPAATLGEGLALHGLARSLLAADTAEESDLDAFDAVVQGWLPDPLPAVLRRMPLAESVGTVLRLLDGQPDGRPRPEPDADRAEASTDWLLEIARFAEGAGLSVEGALQTVPWRAFADEALRVEVLRAMRLSDAALAASAGFNGGENAAAIHEAVARARAATGWTPEPTSADEVVASLTRLSRFFGVRGSA